MKIPLLTSQQSYFNDTSKAGNYWEQYYRKMYDNLRTPSISKTDFSTLEKLCKDYKLKCITFGNYLSYEDRYNYIIGLTSALKDLINILKFGSNSVGFEKLNIAFGDRGFSGSLAHYGPMFKHININRYRSKKGVDKGILFFETGGIHSFGHEYGHFLDNLLGSIYSTSYNYLSNLDTNEQVKHINNDNKKKDFSKISSLFDDFFNKFIWENKSKGVKSRVYKQLEKTSNSKYWTEPCEIWARTFNQWLRMRLEEDKIFNYFLTGRWETSPLWLTKSEMKEIYPLISKIVKAFVPILKK